MKKRTYFEATEKCELGEILISNPNHERDKVRWQRFLKYEDALKEIKRAIERRKQQFSYFRDENGKVVDKISYYERHRLTYRIYRIVETEEEVYSYTNNNIDLKEPELNLKEEMPL